MKCIVHIGTEKTGTTSIQSFLYSNKDTLRVHGILITKSAGKRTHWGLAAAAYALNRRDDYTQKRGLQSDAELSKHQARIIASLKDEVMNAKTAHTVIFSSEQIHSRLRSMGEVRNLKKILTDIGFDDIQIILYLREQAELINSLHNTSVLYGGTEQPKGPNRNEHEQNICDHKQSLQRYSDVFGKANVTPRLFCKDAFVDGSLIRDFMDAAGIDVPTESLSFPGRENQSVSAFGLELLRRLNNKVPRWLEDGTENRIRHEVIQSFQSAFNKGSKVSLSKDLIDAYRKAFADSNEWVRKEYFPEREALFNFKTLHQAPAASLNDDEMEQLVALLGSIWAQPTKPHSSKRKRIRLPWRK